MRKKAELWLARQGLHPHLSAYEAGALTVELRASLLDGGSQRPSEQGFRRFTRPGSATGACGAYHHICGITRLAAGPADVVLSGFAFDTHGCAAAQRAQRTRLTGHFEVHTSKNVKKVPVQTGVGPLSRSWRAVLSRCQRCFAHHCCQRGGVLRFAFISRADTRGQYNRFPACTR